MRGPWPYMALKTSLLDDKDPSFWHNLSGMTGAGGPAAFHGNTSSSSPRTTFPEHRPLWEARCDHPRLLIPSVSLWWFLSRGQDDNLHLIFRSCRSSSSLTAWP